MSFNIASCDSYKDILSCNDSIALVTHAKTTYVWCFTSASYRNTILQTIKIIQLGTTSLQVLHVNSLKNYWWQIAFSELRSMIRLTGQRPAPKTQYFYSTNADAKAQDRTIVLLFLEYIFHNKYVNNTGRYQILSSVLLRRYYYYENWMKYYKSNDF